MSENPKSSPVRTHAALNSFKETIESLVIAFILAFVFRAFTVEAFIIPTGSMADTLRGAHFRLTCPTCGHPFNLSYGNGDTPIPTQPQPVGTRHAVRNDTPICPLCGTQFDPGYRQRVSNGDRILVLKYLYFISEPQIWDVVVFKDPVLPEQNFIKRLVGRPGETVEIIDGDVFINEKIQRKPDHVQNALWIPLYHSDYQPPTEAPGRRNKEVWDSPFQPENSNTAWDIDEHRGHFTFNGSENTDTLRFKRDRLRKTTQSFLAYNGSYALDTDFVSDLKISCSLTPDTAHGKLTLKLGKYRRTYRAEIDFDGACRIINESDNDTVLSEKQFEPLSPGMPVTITFANLDHSLIVHLGGNKLIYLGDDDPKSWGYQSANNSYLPSVTIAGTGDGFTLEHITLFRDVHYTNAGKGNGSMGAGTEDHPFTLQEDEFFVLGDNSPQSHDSRYWDSPKPLPSGKQYRAHIVPRDYLIGRAFFVYWPAGFHLHPLFRFALIPNIGEMRFIH